MQQEGKKPMTLVDLTRELHLRAVRNKYDELLQVAQREKWSYERFLCTASRCRVPSKTGEQPDQAAAYGRLPTVQVYRGSQAG